MNAEGGNSVGVGLAACGIASLFFGTMFVPIKPYNTGDGILITSWNILNTMIVCRLVCSMDHQHRHSRCWLYRQRHCWIS